MRFVRTRARDLPKASTRTQARRGRRQLRLAAADPPARRRRPASHARRRRRRGSTPGCGSSASRGGRPATPAAPARPARSTPAGVELVHAPRPASASSTTPRTWPRNRSGNCSTLSGGPVIASHSNCRAIVPTDRQLSDDMIRAIVERGGVIGINFFDKFLLPPDEYGTAPGDARRRRPPRQAHLRPRRQRTGTSASAPTWTAASAATRSREEIATAADLPKLADALAAAGFGHDAVAGIMGRNWLDFFGRALPA